LKLADAALVQQRARLWFNNVIDYYEQERKHADAEPLRRELASFCKHKAGEELTEYATELVRLGRNLGQMQKGAKGEPLLRAGLAIRQQTKSYEWKTFHAQSRSARRGWRTRSTPKPKHCY
jgi:hypothetical protein